jgi:hypothetical protein
MESLSFILSNQHELEDTIPLLNEIILGLVLIEEHIVLATSLPEVSEWSEYCGVCVSSVSTIAHI